MTFGAIVSSRKYVVRVIATEESAGVEKGDGALLALLFELVERRDALRDDETRDVERRDVAHALLAQARRQRLQILRLRLADDLHAPRLDVFVVAGERQARLLHARTQDRAVEAVVAGDQLQRKIVEVARDERPDRGLEEVFLVHPSMVRRITTEPQSSQSLRALCASVVN